MQPREATGLQQLARRTHASPGYQAAFVFKERE
jgi:hypothetical protein